MVQSDDIDHETVNAARATTLGLVLVVSFVLAAAGLLASFLIGTAASFLWLLR